MGRARIVANIGIGLYTATPLYDTTALERELSTLRTAATEYQTILAKAQLTHLLLIDDASIARGAMNAILQQWIDGIIAAGDEEPEPIEPDDPNDPETGLPWVDPDRAQEAPLLALINAARTDASVGTVSRDDDLDDACLAHLRYQGGNGSMGHTGQWRSKPSDRATQQGYYQPAILHELLAYGETTPANVMSRWQREPATWADLLATDVTHAGVAHVYARTHPGSYLWAVLLASAKGDPITNTVTDDPADDAAEDAEAGLDAIKAPSLDDAKPEKLGEAVRLFAVAQNKVIAAEREVARLMAEKLQRDARIEELENLKTELDDQVIHVWACYYNDELAAGNVVYTAEIPGYWLDNPTIKNIAINSVPYSYEERSWNLVRISSQSGGQLQHSKALLPATVFYNSAIEPGHYLWKPKWRYGTITAVSGNICTVALEALTYRKLSKEESFDLNQAETLANISINYPPCFNEFGSMFIFGDEVLVHFVDQDQSKAEVIGFRRGPRPCSTKRIGWEQIA